MKKYVSVALATAMIASMGVTAFAKNDQYKYDVKDVTFINKTDNGDDEIYFQLKVKRGNTEAFIVDDATTAEGDVSGKVEALKEEMAAYTTARTALAKIADSDITLREVNDDTIKAYGLKVVDALKADATITGEIKKDANVTGLTMAENSFEAVRGKVKLAAEAVQTAKKAEYDKAQAKAEAYAKLKTIADADLKTADSNPQNASNSADKCKAAVEGDVKTFLADVANLEEATKNAIAKEAAAAYTFNAADGKAKVVEAIKTVATGTNAQAATTAADAAKTVKENADAAVTAVTNLKETEVAEAYPTKGAITSDSLTKDLQDFLTEDSKYENDIVKMVVDAVDLKANTTKTAVADAIKALAAPTAKAANIFDAKQESLQGQIDSLGKVSYVAYDEIEDIDDLKVSLKLTAGEDYVADYYIDEIDDAGRAHDGNYGIIIELNDNYTTSKQKIKGTLTLKNKTKKLEEMDFSYNLDVHKVDVEGDGVDGDYAGIKEMTFDGEDVYINLVEFNEDYNVAKFTKDVENIELEDNNGFYFDVKASDQGKVNLAYDNVAIKSVTRVAPVDADLTFYNFYGYPTFDFTGTVTLTPEEDDVEYFVYKVDKDGKISKVNAKLNDDGDAYEFKTRTLGCYVLSDMELNVDDINAGETTPEDKPADGEGTTAPETVKPNPGTGL